MIFSSLRPAYSDTTSCILASLLWPGCFWDERPLLGPVTCGPGTFTSVILDPAGRLATPGEGGSRSFQPSPLLPSFGLRTLHTAARSAGNALTLLLPRPPTQTLHLVNARHSPVFMSDLASPGHTPRPPRPCDISLLHTLTVAGPLHS